MFSNETAFYRLLMVTSFLVAVLKGLRMPAAWDASVYNFNYRNGFMKRGLPGEVFHLLHIPVCHYWVSSVVACVLFGVLIALLWLNLRQSGLDALGESSFSALVASSMFVTYSALLLANVENIVVIYVLLIVLARSPRQQLALALVLGVAAVLTHESYVMTYLPVAMVGLVCWSSDGPRKRWLATLAVAGAVAICSLCVMLIPPRTPEQIAVIHHSIVSRTDFPWDPNLPMVFTNTARSGWNLMEPQLAHPHWWFTEAFVLIAFLPTTLFFLLIARRLAAPYGKWVQAYLAIAVFSPLVVNLIAEDRIRWLNMMLGSSVLCAIAVCWYRKQRGSLLAFGPAWKRGAVFLLVINLVIGVTLFGNRVITFPFEHAWQSFSNLLHNPAHALM